MGGVVTDTIADMLTRIRNASAARHESVDVPASRLKWEIARILKEEGFIADVQRIDRGPQGILRITLRYGPRREPVLTGIRRVSRPGLRVYARRAEVPRVRGGLGVAILSTSRGLMTDRQARRQGVGGEVVAYVW
jgi:small subunit ribosomal protein S8